MPLDKQIQQMAVKPCAEVKALLLWKSKSSTENSKQCCEVKVKPRLTQSKPGIHISRVHLLPSLSSEPVLVQGKFLCPLSVCTHSPLLSGTLGRLSPGSVLLSHSQTVRTGGKCGLGGICSPVLTHTCDTDEHQVSHCVTFAASCKSHEPTLGITVIYHKTQEHLELSPSTCPVPWLPLDSFAFNLSQLALSVSCFFIFSIDIYPVNRD